MGQKNLTLFILAAMLLLVISGCSQETVNSQLPAETAASQALTTDPMSNEEEQSAGLKLFEVKAFRFGFEPNALTVKKGETVMIKASTIDGTHGIAIPEYGVDLKLSPDEEPKTAVFVAEKVGEFTIFCNTPCGSGHSTMQGKLIVEE